jgi:hypothetical protein
VSVPDIAFAPLPRLWDTELSQGKACFGDTYDAAMRSD